MNPTRRLQVTLMVLLAGTLILITGCGHMAMQAIKDGISDYVSGGFASGLINEQLADFLGNIVPSGSAALSAGG